MPPSSARSVAEDALAPPAVGLAGRLVGGAVMSSFMFGYSICVLNSCGELISVNFEWCGNDWQSDCIASRGSQGLINASVYLGAALGALLSGRSWFHALGSRTQLVLSDVYFAAGAVICALSAGVGTLIVGRFASGLGLGISAIATPMFVAEISPRERRGSNCAMHGVFITLGILASIAFGIPQSPPPSGPGETLSGLDVWYWRGLLGFPLVVSVIQALFFFFVCPVDPPSLLVARGEMKLARSVLYRTYGLEVPEKMNLSNKGQAALELQLKDLKEAVDTAKTIPRIRVIQAMFDPFLRTAVFLGVGLAAFQQLCGINGLMAYSNSLFADAGIKPSLLTLASTLMASANVLASIFSSRLVDHWGRRKLLLFGAFCQTVAMALVTFFIDPRAQAMMPPGTSGPAAVVCFTIFVMSFSFGLGAVTWLYLSEIYPMEIRGPSLSACGVVNWLASFIVVFGTRFLTLQSACHVFGMVCFVGLLGTYVWVVETKGCSMDDSPLTPKSGRGSSPLLTPNSPNIPYKKMQDEEDEDSDEEFSLEGAATPAGGVKAK
mmetsp:Transcript_145084/g.464966  ORF Transcript_145084/g.464966 Transcript_145084/m.464966 type:complete len:550 (-) Transcript_145084:111-1760(-)